MNTPKKGFSLVEIMIVVGIIALLAAIAIPNLTRAKLQSNDAVAKTSLKTISTALENYFSINNRYPSATTSLNGASPPYLNKDYFTGTHNGFVYSASTLTDYTYNIEASPLSANVGSTTFTMSTGGVASW